MLATFVVCLVRVRDARMQSSTLRRITNTTEEGINLNPSISGDGRTVGFESTEDIAGAGGTDHFRAVRANITSDPPSFFQIAGSRFVAPAISQDGSRIAFASRDDLLGTNSDGNSEIFLFDGAKLIQVTNTSPGSLANRITNGNFQPSISDDGRFIAFSSNRDLAGQNSDGNLEIFVYDSTASSFSQLTNSSGIVGFTDAKISGDGFTVAYIRDNGATPGSARDLLKQPRVGLGPIVLIGASIQSLQVTYGRAISDDGARVVYAAETATNTTQVFMFDGRSGGTIRQITTLGARVTEVPLDPTISGDGSRIAFAARRTVSGAGSNSDGGVELYVYDFPTATFSKITNAPSSATAEVVSSLSDDGSIVAFNFPRVLSGAVTNSGTENNSEIYALAPPGRPANGTLTAILNDASFGHEPSATKALAPNSIAAAQGTNLANTTTQTQRLADRTFPTSVGGVRVTVNGRAAQIFFISPAQINFLVPPQTETGTAEVIVTNSENFPARGTVSILRAAPGIFTKTGDGIGEGLILNADTLQEGPFDPTGGDLRLTIFATGARNAAVTTVSIGGRIVNSEAAVSSNTLPGLDEVHVRVPADLRGAGTVNLSVTSDGRDSNPVTINFLGDPTRAIFFNEVLSDPPNGAAGDANNDGVRDGTDDEFVEFVNGSANDTIGMSGWTVKTRATGSTTETTRFTFPAGTSVAPGTAAVVFGGGTFNSSDPIFGCAQVFKATSSSGLSLTNAGLTILLRDSAGNLIAQFAYGGSTGLDGNNSQSLTRSPDISGAFVLHTTANPARRFSPGLKIDGTPFGNCASHPATVTISPTATTVNQGPSTQFTAQAFDQFGRAMTGVPIAFNSDNTAAATIDSTSTNQSTGVVTANVGTHNPGVAHITASATDGTTTANSSPATLTVAGPALSLSDVSKNEGNGGPTTFTFAVSLSLPAPSGGVKFDIATQDGTATVANNDYVARALTNQVIPAGAQSYSFDVTVNGDTAIEPNENFFVSVSNVSGASITKGQGTGTILNDDSPTLSVSDVSSSEGNSGTKTFTFTVTTPVAAGPGPIMFDIATADGTATSASGDYVARTLTGQTIPVGQSSYNFDVTVNGDTLAESNETFFVNITNVSGAQVNDGQAQGTIQNDDNANLVISQAYPGGGLSNATYANDFIELYNRGTSTIDFSVTPYSAQFLSTSGSTWTKTDLTSGVIAPGRYFLIREASGGATGSPLPTADANGTINLTSTTDGKVALVAGTTLLTGSCPGDDGTQPFNPANVADLVGYGGTAATANHCYEGTGPVAFTLGNNTIAAFRKAGGCVDTNDNTSDFFTAQPNARNSASPIGDCKPEITINDVTVTEGNSGTVNANFTVTLSAASAQTVKVDFATADGTANTPADYQSNNGTLTFNPGDLTKTITVLVNGDTMDEPNETFFVNLSNVSNAVVLDSQGQGTINDNDAAPSLSINDVVVSEGDSASTSATFTVSLSAASGFTVTVNYATADNTATAGSDYQATNGTVTFNPGETSKPVTVLVNGDTDFEQNESFFVNLSSPLNATIADGQGVGTINNDDPLPPTPNFFIDDVNLSEGNTGTKTADFTVTLNPEANQQVTVQFATANGTATAGSDYQSNSNTLTFAPGETSKQVSININGDTLVEPDETFFVNLSNASAGTNIGDPQGIGTIQNDDAADVVISQVYPGGGLTNATYASDFIELFNRGTTTVDFSATPSSVQFLSTTASTWSKTDLTSGTILPGHYFLIKETSGGTGAALPAADATGTINLTSTTSGKVALVSNTTLLTGNCPGDDGTQPFNPTNVIDFVGYAGTAATANHCYEGNGPASFTLSNNTIAAYRKAGGCTDTNDNAADFFAAAPFPRNSLSTNNCAGGATPTLSINDVTINEGNSGTTAATFTVSLSGPAQGADVTFDIATANGTATTADNDYAAKSLTNQVIPAGQTSYTFTVNVNGDNNVESDEAFVVNVTNVLGASVSDGQGTATIQNDDLPAISINDVSVTEGNSGTTNLDFTVSLSAPAPATVTFDIATADGTATTSDNDYVASSLTGQTIAAGQQTYHFFVTVNGDPGVEANETLFVNLTNVTGATVGDGQGQGTIANDDSPTFSITQSVSLAEGNSGTTNATFTVTLSPTSNQTVTVQYATADGTAKSTSDYQSTSGTLTFDPGDAIKTIDVPINGDLLVEPDETFTLTLSNPSAGSAISPTNGTGTGTIQNDDTAVVVVSQVYAGGGNTSAPAAVYKNDFIEVFNRGTTTVDLAGWSVQYNSASGTGNWSVTQLCATGPCLLSPGQYFLVQEAQGTGGTQNLPTPDAIGTIAMATASGKVALVSNATALNGACPSNANILDKVGYGGSIATTDFCYEGTGPTAAPSNVNAAFRKAGGCTDTNDNVADFFTFAASPRNSASPINNCSGAATANLSINDVTVTEGNSGTTTATFTVSLSAPAQGTDVTFDISTQDNTATIANNDYVAKSLTNQIIPAGQSTYTFSVTVNGDTNVEPDESFFVNLTNVAGANVTDGQGTGTIQHDDFPALSVDDVAAAEGDSGTTTFTFHVTLSDPAPATVTFDIATADGTAQDHNPVSEDNDYQARSLTSQTIAQGASSFDFAVTVNGDTANEPNETFFVNVSNVSGATVADAQGLGTIQNDDAPPDLSITDVTQAEGNAGTSSFNFTVQLSAPAKAGGVSFTVNTADGTAAAGSDYLAIVNGSGSIPEGSSSTTVAVTVNGDTVFEGNETFFVNLSNVTGANVTDSQGLGTISNDDNQPSLAIADASVIEGNSGTSLMTFTVTMTGSSQSSVTVNYATSDSSATVADADYDAASGMLTFAPGDTTRTFDVTIHGDTMPEGDEMFLVDLTSPSGATISDSQAFGTIFLDDAFSIAAVNTAYTENFDSLAQSGNSSTTPTAWTRAETLSSANTVYTANNGGSTTGDTYSYGTTSQTDRALGGLRTGSLAPTIGAYFKNDTGSTINSLTIAYTGEEWRLGTASRTDRLDFQYSTNATSLTTGTWTDDDALDFTTPNTTATGAKDGNNATNRTALTHTISGLSIAAGATFWIRWTDFDASGADDGLAVDDFSITAGVNTPALTIDDLSQSEGDSGTTTFNFNVHLSSPAPPGGVSFTINTADGATNPATAGSDYVAIVNGIGNIAQNGTSTTVSVTVNGDVTVEPNETFFVNISNVTGATVSDGQALGTIQNDDSPPATADLSVSKTDSPDAVAIGNDITYTITVTNSGPDPATNAVLSETTPANTTFRSITPPAGWTCGTTPAVGGTGAISCTNSNFAVASAAFNLVVRVGSSVTDNTIITNTASVSSSTSDSNPHNNSAVAVTTVKQPLLVISQVYGGGGNAGAPYKNDFIEIFNRGSTTVDFSATPYSVQYISDTGTGTWSITTLSGSIAPGRYYLVQEAAGAGAAPGLPTPDATGSIAMAAGAGKVALVQGTTAINSNTTSPATPLTSQGAAGCPNNSTFSIADFVGYGTTASCSEGATRAPAPSNTTADLRASNGCTDTNINGSDFAAGAPNPRNSSTAANYCGPDLSTTKTSSVSIVQAGNNITYTVTLNNGSGATNVFMNDRIPLNTTFQSMSVPAGWTCITPAINGTGDVNCVPAGSFASATFSIVVNVNAATTAGTVITNTATASDSLADPNSANNSSTATVTVVSATSADLSITQTDSPDPVSSGSNVTYTFTVTNNGPASASSLQVNGNVPANTTFQGLTPPAGWTCITPAIGGTGSITCTRPSFSSGASQNFPFIVKVNNGVSPGTVLTNLLTITSATTDYVSGNNTSTETTTTN